MQGSVVTITGATRNKVEMFCHVFVMFFSLVMFFVMFFEQPCSELLL